MRGAIVYGEILNTDFEFQGSGNGKYNINSVYGKGLVEAYLKAESQQWAGTVVDSTMIEYVRGAVPKYESLLDRYAVKYPVPYKMEGKTDPEYVLRLFEGNLNDYALKNLSVSIERNFRDYKKNADHSSAQLKLKNTIQFLESFRSNQEG